MKMCSRSICQPLALHQRQQDGDRKRKRHESETGGLWYKAYGLCEGPDVSCAERKGEHTHTLLHLLLQSPPWDEQTDVWRGCSDMLGLSELIQPFLNDNLSSAYHLSPLSSPPCLLITAHFHGSSRVAHTVAAGCTLAIQGVKR